MGKVVDIVGRRKALVLSYFVWIPTTIWFILCRSYSELLLMLVVSSIGGALFMPAQQALLADMIPRGKRGRIMGAIGNLNLVASAIASVVAGFLYELDPRNPFVFCIFSGIVSLILLLTVVREPEVREV
jgi:MFS family permease